MNNESLTDSFQEAREAYEALPSWEKFRIDWELEDLIRFERLTKETKELKKQRQREWNKEI